MKKLYIDTNVIIDAVEGRKNLFGITVGNPAADLFFAAASCRYDVILSTWARYELSVHKTDEETKMFFAIVKKKKIDINYTEEDIAEAKKNNPNHFQDELHGMLALRAGADYIVTRNTKDFENFKGKISVVKPEELL